MYYLCTLKNCNVVIMWTENRPCLNLNRLIIMEINNIGNNAGLIWTALNTNVKMTESKLKKETGLASADFYAALGWLAREGKLNTITETRCGKDCEYFTL